MMNTKVEKKAKRVKDVSVSNDELECMSIIDTLLWRFKTRLDETSDQGQVIAMTSCCRGSGVSTLLANLGVQAAKNQMGPVLVVDANLAAPRQHRLFRHKTTTGLVDVILGEAGPSEAIFQTGVESLDIMPSGVPSHLLTGRVITENCEELFQWARDRYAMILVDLPQVDDLRHGLMIARQANMVLVAIRSNFVSRSNAQQSVERLISDGVKVAGTILSRQSIYTPKILRG